MSGVDMLCYRQDRMDVERALKSPLPEDDEEMPTMEEPTVSPKLTFDALYDAHMARLTDGSITLTDFVQQGAAVSDKAHAIIGILRQKRPDSAGINIPNNTWNHMHRGAV